MKVFVKFYKNYLFLNIYVINSFRVHSEVICQLHVILLHNQLYVTDLLEYLDLLSKVSLNEERVHQIFAGKYVRAKYVDL